MEIYCGNLAFGATKEDLEQLFAQFGTVERSNVVLDRETGRSRGFGFITMPDVEAEIAIAKLDGQDFQGRRLNVKKGEKKEDRPRQEFRSKTEGDRGDFVVRNKFRRSY